MTDSLNNIIKNDTSNSLNETEKTKSSKNINEFKDNNIITSNIAQNIKNSINSEDEDNKIIKKGIKM